jgi:hypothetical protein
LSEFHSSSAFYDTKIPFRGVVEQFERRPVQVTLIRCDRLFQVLELDNNSHSRLVGFSRLRCNDQATSQTFECDCRELCIFGNNRRIRHRLVTHHPISFIGHRVLLIVFVCRSPRNGVCDSPFLRPAVEILLRICSRGNYPPSMTNSLPMIAEPLSVAAARSGHEQTSTKWIKFAPVGSTMPCITPKARLVPYAGWLSRAAESF